MKDKIKKIFFLIFILNLFWVNFFIAPSAEASIELVRSKDSGTIYYIDSSGIRHSFPNLITYKSWYGNDFSHVVTVDNGFLQNYPLGKNITIRQGTYLVKIQTAPQVYAVEQGGVLREITDESIAEAIYGKNWNKRVVDVPDVFFSDYVVGDTLSHDYSLPDGILIQNSATKKYYYKNNKILRSFTNDDALAKNYFRLSDAIVSSREFFVRARPINGLDKNVFNPAVKPIIDLRDCENKKLRGAVIFLADKDYSNTEITNLEKIKKEIPNRFSWATENLSAIDFSLPTAIMIDDGYFLQKRLDGTIDVNNEVINSFYDTHADDFDFILIWTNFKIPSDNTNEIAHFTPVTNRQEGSNIAMLNRSEIFGSQGKLKGVIMMGNINRYNSATDAGMNEVMNFVLHEILHQWSGNINFTDANGKLNRSLLRQSDYQHWSYYAGFVSPLGGSGWLSNGDGTFTSELSLMGDSVLRKYSMIDLYLMGLIPYQLMPPVYYIEPKDQGVLGNTIAGQIRWVTVDQIIKANGKIQCSLD